MTSGKAEFSSFTDFTNEPIYLYLQCFIFLTVDFILQFHIFAPSGPIHSSYKYGIFISLQPRKERLQQLNTNFCFNFLGPEWTIYLTLNQSQGPQQWDIDKPNKTRSRAKNRAMPPTKSLTKNREGTMVMNAVRQNK